MVRIKCVEDIRPQRAVLKVIGMGGAGGNAVNRMAEAKVQGIELIAANTDAQVLKLNKAGFRIQLGEKLTRGLGAGGDPGRGREAAIESRDALREALAGSDLVFITAGMGGGTGTGAAPIAAQVAKELGALTVGVVSRPFEFEGRYRKGLAETGIQDLKPHVDALLVIANDLITGIIDEKTTASEAFHRADDVLRQAIQAISDLITTAGDINVDMEDVKSILSGAGDALMGVGEREGPGRALEAAKEAVRSPLLDNAVMDGAQRVIVNITASRGTLTMSETKEAMEFIHRAANPEAKVKYGQAYDDNLEGRIRVAVIAAGFPPRRAKKPARSARPGAPADLDLSPIEPRQPTSREDEWSRPAFLRVKDRRLS